MLPGSWIHPQSVDFLRGRMDEGKSIEFCGFLNVFDLTQLNNSMLRCSLQGSSKIVKNSDSISVTFVCKGWAWPWPLVMRLSGTCSVVNILRQ